MALSRWLARSQHNLSGLDTGKLGQWHLSMLVQNNGWPWSLKSTESDNWLTTLPAEGSVSKQSLNWKVLIVWSLSSIALQLWRWLDREVFSLYIFVYRKIPQRLWLLEISHYQELQNYGRLSCPRKRSCVYNVSHANAHLTIGYC